MSTGWINLSIILVLKAKTKTKIKDKTVTTYSLLVPNFNKLTVNKSLNNVQLGQNTTISNTVTLQNGNFDLKNFDLTLNGNYILNNGGYFITSGTGRFSQEVMNGGTKIFPIGNSTYTPMTILNNGTADVFFIRTTPEVLENGASGNVISTSVVDRTWFVEEAVTGDSDLTLTATWNASDEMAGFDRTQSYLSHYIANRWNGTVPGAASGSDTYSISRSNVTNLSPFAVGSNGVLPIELLSFQAFRQEGKVQLVWATATEINSDYFEIEHSKDGIRFEKIGIVNANGFSNSPLDYSFLHQNPHKRINYYRLKMNDLDSSFDYSEVKSVNFLNQGNVEELVTIYPNPSGISSFTLFIPPNKIEKIELFIYDNLGRLIRQLIINNSKTEIKVSDLGAGIYLIRVDMKEVKAWKRLIIE